MEIQFYRSLWGMEGDLREKLRLVAEQGYHGIEHHRLPPVDPQQWKDLLAEFSLKATILAKVDDFKSGREIFEATAAYNPELIMSHTGLDRYDLQSGMAIVADFLKLEEDLGVDVVHETHRHRIFYSPFTTRPYLEKFPELKLLADFSHWCVVCESDLQDLDEFLEPAINSSHHIHARVGYDQGPQVPDPSAPEYASFLTAHEGWWDRIIEQRQRENKDVLIVTPEFGPARYMHTLPHTNQPVSNLSDVCIWMRERLKSRWGNVSGVKL